MPLQEIDPDRCYKFSQAAKLLTSRRDGRPVHPDTLRTWRRQGKLQCINVPINGRNFWWVKGIELMKLEAAFREPHGPGWEQLVLKLRSPAQAQRDHEAAVAYLKQHGA